jgi:hypothetical protein
VTPDIVLPDVFNYSLQIGESNLDNPLAWDTIEPATYDKLDLVQPYLAELTDRSNARIATNQDFAYVRQDIEQYKKTQTDGTATLNEHEAIKERERDTLRGEERDKEREGRPDPGIKIYELTVKNSTLPGLPPPENWMGQTNSVSKATAAKTPPPFDPVLDETERILEDYVSVSPKGGSLTVNP